MEPKKRKVLERKTQYQDFFLVLCYTSARNTQRAFKKGHLMFWFTLQGFWVLIALISSQLKWQTLVFPCGVNFPVVLNAHFITIWYLKKANPLMQRIYPGAFNISKFTVSKKKLGRIIFHPCKLSLICIAFSLSSHRSNALSFQMRLFRAA